MLLNDPFIGVPGRHYLCLKRNLPSGVQRCAFDQVFNIALG
jgi:hypothetical protein